MIGRGVSVVTGAFSIYFTEGLNAFLAYEVLEGTLDWVSVYAPETGFSSFFPIVGLAVLLPVDIEGILDEPDTKASVFLVNSLGGLTIDYESVSFFI